MTLSCVIPAHNEEGCIKEVVSDLVEKLSREQISFEIIIVDDNSTDQTGVILDKMAASDVRLKIIHRRGRPGFGLAIKEGLDNFSNDTVCITMGDGSDCASDVVRLFKKIQEGFDVVYGSRFIDRNSIVDYPPFKLFFNRCGNYLIKIIFGLKNDTDITNAFKIYRREVIEAIRPIKSRDFNITLELPLKAHLRGFNRVSIPVKWFGRKSNVSKFSVFKMSRCYLLTLIMLWIFRDLP